MTMPSSLPRDIQRSESGQSTLELAFSLPIFLVLILGSAEIANLAWSAVQVNNSARAGAAFASLSRINAADNIDIGKAAQNEAPTLVTAPATQVTSTEACSCVGSDGSSSSIACDNNALQNCPYPGVVQVAVQVNVQAAVTPFVHFLGLPASYTIHGQATVGVEQ
jgi:Flp pilus assembly protein TadG